MATRTISNRLLQFGSSSCLHSTSFNGLDLFIASADFSTASSTIRGFSFRSSNSLNSFSRYTDARPISQLVHSNGKRSFLVDTLALVRRLEAQGVPTKQAEGITRDVIEVLNDNLGTVVQSFISKADMQKDHQFGMLQRETERIKGELEKLRSELRHEIDKVTAGQRLDLNLEKWAFIRMATRTISNRLVRFGSNYLSRTDFNGGLSRTNLNGSDSLIASAPFTTAASAIRSSDSMISLCRYTDSRKISQLAQSNGKRLFLVDTLALVRRLESQGLPTKQAEAITGVITEVLNDSLESVGQSFISKAEMHRIEVVQESSLAKFKFEIEHSKEHHFTMLQRETERLKGEIEKLRSELRYEIDKVTAGQRLDLNLEKGRIRDELANQTAEINHLTQKIDREVHSVRVNVEASKTEVIKYGIGILVSAAAIGVASLRKILG